MAISSKTLIAYVQDQPYDKLQFVDTIYSIVRVVLLHHFSNLLYDEDVISLGVTKALDTLSQPFINPSKSLVNMLYTCVRNEIGNTYKRTKRISDNSEPVYETTYMDTHSISVTSKLSITGEVQANLERFADNLLGFGIEIDDSIDHYFEKDRDDFTAFEKFILRAATAKTILHLSK